MCPDCERKSASGEPYPVLCKQCQAPYTLSETGFEGKPLRVVIENWLYNTKDLSLLMSATTELRRRFTKTFPAPEWVKGIK